jgi:hypothetical protein
MVFKDAHAYAKSCEAYQKFVGREKRSLVPLQLVVVEEQFEQWGLDMIGKINPHSSRQHKYILTTTNYFTRWT